MLLQQELDSQHLLLKELTQRQEQLAHRLAETAASRAFRQQGTLVEPAVPTVPPEWLASTVPAATESPLATLVQAPDRSTR